MHPLTVTHLVMSDVYFLHKSKAFDRVWHEGLIYKVKCIGLTGLPLELQGSNELILSDS